ncbi:G1 family glutamic endopeptidase [Mesorhizobium sp. M1365]|uniref:G1 family glutamic endopeptidase n=1 Tax=Mesorhizobium sp. M1365 TaxID=2957090 RepID=UPI00333B3C3A
MGRVLRPYSRDWKGPVPRQTINWAGYSKIGKRFTSVSGGWQVPSITHNPKTPSVQSCSCWIGIGGNEDDPTLIQVGTEQVASPDNSKFYAAWYGTLQMSYRVLIPQNVLGIDEGDSIWASVSCPSNSLPFTTQTWVLKIVNVTKGFEWSHSLNYTSSLATADWMFEANKVDDVLSALPKFKEVVFDRSKVNGQNAGFVRASDGIELIDTESKIVLANPSNASGGNFRVGPGGSLPASPSNYLFKMIDGGDYSCARESKINDKVVVVGANWRGDRILGLRVEVDDRPAVLKPYSVDARETQFCGINAAGDVIGYAVIPFPLPMRIVPFIYKDDNFSDISNVVGLDMAPVSWNDGGVIVGNTMSYPGYACIYRPGSGLEYLPQYSSIRDINNNGVFIASKALDQRVISLKVVNGVETEINFPGATRTLAWGINDLEDIVGGYYADGGSGGFLLKNGVYEPVDYPYGETSFVQGINNLGQMVGLTNVPMGKGTTVFLAFKPQREN